MELIIQTPFNIPPSLLPNRSEATMFMCDPSTLTQYSSLSSSFISWSIFTNLLVSSEFLLILSRWKVTYNLAACTEAAADRAADWAAAPYVASAADANIASSAATLGESRLFDVGGCSKGSSNKSDENGGSLHFEGVGELKS